MKVKLKSAGSEKLHIEKGISLGGRKRTRFIGGSGGGKRMGGPGEKWEERRN